MSLRIRLAMPVWDPILVMVLAVEATFSIVVGWSLGLSCSALTSVLYFIFITMTIRKRGEEAKFSWKLIVYKPIVSWISSRRRRLRY